MLRNGRTQRRIVRSKLAVGFVAALAVAAIGSAAWATIPDTDGVIHACFKKSGGALRVIDASVASCKSDESALDWNQAGAPGPVGAQGPQGPEGPAGPPGSAGLGEVFVVIRSTEVEPGQDGFLLVSCPVGRLAVSGSWILGLSSPDVTVTRSHRQSPVTWNFGLRNDTASSVTLIGNVLCATGTEVPAP